MLLDACFCLSVTHNWSYFGSPCWSQSGLLSKLHRVGWHVLCFLLPSNITLSKLRALCLKGLSDVFLNQKRMHHHFLTIFWLNTANRFASSAWIILRLLIPAVCFSMFLLPWFNIWCLVTMFLLLCSVDYLCPGCSPHSDGHSHGGEASAAYDGQVSMRMFEGCMINCLNVKALIYSICFIYVILEKDEGIGWHLYI